VKEDFHLVRLPFIGLTPFFEALTQIARFQQRAQIKDHEIKNWFDTMRNDSNFTPILHYFSKVIGSPINQLTSTEILKLQQLDNPFWHDCIKWGTRREGIPADALRQKWEKWKMIFTTQKVAETLFDQFDTLFESIREEENLRKGFESLYQQLHREIVQTLHARSQPLLALIDTAGRQAYERWTTEGGPKKYGKRPSPPMVINPPQLCVDGDFAVMLTELIHNAIKFADTTYEVEVTAQQIAIRNDGAPFDRSQWEKRLKSKRYPDICLRHLLEFDIGPCPGRTGAEVKISGYNLHLAAVEIPINAGEMSPEHYK
jgi:signal transduction histidine kinase